MDFLSGRNPYNNYNTGVYIIKDNIQPYDLFICIFFQNALILVLMREFCWPGLPMQ